MFGIYQQMEWCMRAILVFIGTMLMSVAYADSKKYEIKWILAHEPARLFEKAAAEFAQRIEKKTSGAIKVTVINPTKNPEYKNIDVKTAFDKVQSGELQMSQTYTTFLGNYNKQMWILDLPFLFRNHDHASRVLDGKIGRQILAGLDQAKVQGLAFTYSGGYRIIPTQAIQLTSMDSFKGQKIGVAADSPVAQAYLRQLKAEPIMVSDVALAGSKNSEGFETTYARLNNLNSENLKYLNETEHTLFLTSILINKEFFEQLPKKFQKYIRETALEVAKMERDESIKDNLNSRKEFVEKHQMTVVQMPPAELEKMKGAAAPVYDTYSKILNNDIIKQIQASGN